MEEQEDIPNIPVNQEVVVEKKVEPQPDLTQVMQSNPATPPSVITYKKKRGFIDYFIYFVSAVAFLIWVAVVALYFQNKNKKETVNQVASSETSPTVTAVAEKKFSITTKNGNVININEKGDEEILVKKEDYEFTGISGFIKVSVSPNKKKLCFESWPPSPQPALYLSDIEGTGVLKVNSNRRNCYWSGDSSKVVYNDVKSEKEATNLYVYDLEGASETLLTVHTATESAKPKLHTAVGWSADNKKVLCQYSFQKTPKDIRECEVDIETKFVNYF